MSTIRRLKDRGGAGCKITAVNPAKTLTPDKLPAVGKENSARKPRVPAASAAQKPAVKVVPRVDKTAAVASLAGGGERRRLSSSSVPRGRSPSPTQFARVSSVRKDSKVVSVKSEKNEWKNGFCADKKSGVVSVKRNGSCEDLVGLRDSSGTLSGNGRFEKKSDVGVGDKYPSKLHEKLAFLEGKVKRIASDIKRTKEMLDANNPDASKVILSDIQDKILGIEKAMGNAVDGKVGLLKGNAGGEGERKVGGEGLGNKDVKSSDKPLLDSVELESRLFPHYKLLKDWSSASGTAGSSQSQDGQVSESACSSKGESKSLKPVEENSIEHEFLASLNKENTSDTTKNDSSGLKPCDVQEMEGASTSNTQGSLNASNGPQDLNIILTSDEKIEDFDDRENRPGLVVGQESSDNISYPLNEIGRKTSTAGWFVSDGEAVLLAHDDGSCSYYDIVNSEEKAVYKPPPGVSPHMWRDCWILRAPSSDGCSGKYVVAASAGNSLDTGFCSWDFYTGDVRGFHTDGVGPATSRAVLGPLKISYECEKYPSSSAKSLETQQWWYRPCGPLIISAASSQNLVKIYDIRDGEQVMSWELQKPVSSLDVSSPLQWRNRGNVVIAEAESITLWDVNSLSPQALRSIPLHGRKVSALHVNNTDAEIGGGVRRRVTSSEAEANNGVFCTPESINILDFRDRTGVGLRIPNLSANVQSVFSHGDSIYLGCTRSAGKSQSCVQVQQYSLHKQRLVASYDIPESDAVDQRHVAITQVWGNSESIMAVSGLGLFIFDSHKDDGLHSVALNFGSTQKARQVVGPDDLYSPTFDYSSSRALLISRDRPALWKHIEEACIL